MEDIGDREKGISGISVMCVDPDRVFRLIETGLVTPQSDIDIQLDFASIPDMEKTGQFLRFDHGFQDRLLNTLLACQAPIKSNQAKDGFPERMMK